MEYEMRYFISKNGYVIATITEAEKFIVYLQEHGWKEITLDEYEKRLEELGQIYEAHWGW